MKIKPFLKIIKLIFKKLKIYISTYVSRIYCSQDTCFSNASSIVSCPTNNKSARQISSAILINTNICNHFQKQDNYGELQTYRLMTSVSLPVYDLKHYEVSSKMLNLKHLQICVKYVIRS